MTTRLPRPRASLRTRAGVFAVSITGVGVGVALTVEADFGVAPNDVMNTGLADVLGWGVGTVTWLTSGIAMLLAWSLGRRPRVATVLGGVVVGLSVNGALAVLPSPDSVALRVAVMSLGLLVLWAAITGVISADLGIGPLELVMLGLMDRGVGIRVARWGIEFALVAIGLALGGVAGLGTALFAFGTGPVLAITLPPATARLGTDLRHPDEVGSSG